MSCPFDSTSDLWELKLLIFIGRANYQSVAFHDIFLDRFFNPHPTHLSMTVSVDGSGLMTNLTPRKSLMCLSVSIPFGESFPTRIFETSCGHNAQRRNNRPYKPAKLEQWLLLDGRMLTATKTYYGTYRKWCISKKEHDLKTTVLCLALFLVSFCNGQKELFKKKLLVHGTSWFNQKPKTWWT